MNPVRRTSGRIGLSFLLLSVALGTTVLGVTGCGARAPDPLAKLTAASPEAVKTTGAQRLLKDTPFERTWDLDLKKPVSNAWILPELPDTVFFQLKETNELVAVDALSGHTRWVSMPLPETCTRPPSIAHVRVPSERNDVAVYDDRLYLIAQDVLFTFDVGSGQLIWRYELPFSPSSAPKPVGVDSALRVFIGDWAGRLKVVSYEMNRNFPFIAWQQNISATITAPVIEYDGLVYANDGVGLVHAYRLDGQNVWNFKAGGRMDGAGVIRDRVLFVGTADRILYAINRLTGEKLGQVNLNAPLTRAPFVFAGDDDRVYTWVAADQGERSGLYAFVAKNDTVPFTDLSRHALEVVRMGSAWHLPAVDRLVCSTPGHLYLTAGESTLVQAVERATGTIEWTWDIAIERAAERRTAGITLRDARTPLKLVEYVDPAEMNRSIFAIDGDGIVVAYRFFGYIPPTASKGQAAPELSADKAPAKTAKAEEAAPVPAP